MTTRSARVTFIAAFLAGLLALAVAVLATGAQQERPNGAGLVVRHGDGTLIYAYVEFEGESINGEELLARAGLQFTVAPFGGFGAGICAIDNEGCPADDCWCESYSSPAYYWHYFAWTGDGWGRLPHGASSRELHDGDIDGWSWTSGDAGLPPVTIDEIARLNGFERGQPATPTPLPPPPTATATATSPPEPSATPADTATPMPSNTATQPETAGSDPSPTRPPKSTATWAASTATSTPEPPGTLAPATPTPTATSTAMASPTATDADREAGAVIVRPSETPEPLDPARDDDASDSGGNLLLFTGFAAAIGLAGLLLLLKRLRGAR